MAQLAKELSSLKKSLSRRGASAYDDTRDTASDLYGELRDRFTEALPFMRKRAHAVEQVARDNPATAAAVGPGRGRPAGDDAARAQAASRRQLVVRSVELIRREVLPAAARRAPLPG